MSEVAERGIDLQRNAMRHDRARSMPRSSTPGHRQRARELARLGPEQAA